MTTFATMPTVDPRVLEEHASRLRLEGRRLRAERSELERSVRTLTWEGRAGDRYRERTRTRLRDLDVVADDLELAARQLDMSAQEAARVRAELCRTRDRVFSLRTVLGGDAFDGLLRDKGVPIHLPPAHDRMWRSIGRLVLG